MAPPNPEPEVADVPTVNLIHYTSPLTSADSTSGHTELSLPEEINSHGGISASSGETCLDPEHLLDVNVLHYQLYVQKILSESLASTSF
jgi:hypothetical protein